MSRRDTGILGEKLAGEFLQKRGYRILETNFRCHEGEVDIIARDGEYLAFVEVRAKKNLAFGHPEESITPAKMKRLIATAYNYLEMHDSLYDLWRIDVVAIELDNQGKPSRIELIESAVDEP